MQTTQRPKTPQRGAGQIGEFRIALYLQDLQSPPSAVKPVLPPGCTASVRKAHKPHLDFVVTSQKGLQHLELLQGVNVRLQVHEAVVAEVEGLKPRQGEQSRRQRRQPVAGQTQSFQTLEPLKHPACGGCGVSKAALHSRALASDTEDGGTAKGGCARERRHLEIRQMHGSSNFSQTTFLHLRSSDWVKSSTCSRGGCSTIIDASNGKLEAKLLGIAP